MGKTIKATDVLENACRNIDRRNNVITKNVNTKLVTKLRKNAPIKTGKLKRSITKKDNVIKMNDYGLTLNDGSSKIPARHWIDKSINESGEEVAKAVANSIFKFYK